MSRVHTSRSRARVAAICALLGAMLASTACAHSGPGVAAATPTLRPDTAAAVVRLGARPDEPCDPAVPASVADVLADLGHERDPAVSQRLQEIRASDQGERLAGEGPLPPELAGAPDPSVATTPIPSGQPSDLPSNSPATFGALAAADAERRREVLDYVLAGRVVDPDDLLSAALIFNHGLCTDHLALAALLSQKALERGATTDRRLYAVAIDRYLLRLGRPQKFGTQYEPIPGCAGACRLAPVDESTTDAERAHYDVEPLAEAQANASSGRVICAALPTR